MILITIIFIILNLILAKIDAKKILAQKPINHGINLAVYVGLIIVVFGLNANMMYNLSGINQILLLLYVFLIRKVVFDISLSLFRGLKWNYISNTTGSKIDRIENKIFKSGTIKYIFYSILLITYITVNILL